MPVLMMFQRNNLLDNRRRRIGLLIPLITVLLFFTILLSLCLVNGLSFAPVSRIPKVGTILTSRSTTKSSSSRELRVLTSPSYLGSVSDEEQSLVGRSFKNNLEDEAVETSSTTTWRNPFDEITPAQQEQEEIKPHSPRVALLLNMKARGVTADMVDACEKILGADNVYVTGTEDDGDGEEARTVALEEALWSYDLLVPAGGDGTLSYTIQTMCDHRVAKGLAKNQEDALRQLPAIAYVPLGTGNGVGSVVGCRVPQNSKGKNSSSSKNNENASINGKGNYLFGGLRRRLRSIVRSILGWMMKPFQAKRQRTQKLVSVLESLKENLETRVNGSNDNDDVHGNNFYGLETVSLPIISVEKHHQNQDTSGGGGGELCFFAGVGFDSLMLNDFKIIKDWSLRNRFLSFFKLNHVLSSVAGYCAALVVRTLPQCFLKGKHKIDVTITTQDAAHTLWVDHRRGDLVQPVVVGKGNDDNEENRRNTPSQSTTLRTNDTLTDIPTSTLLYQGNAGIVAAGTCPFYGGGLRLFPFARMTSDKMHLRVGRIHPATGFFRIPSIFAGSYRDKSDDGFGCLDFIGSTFEIQVADASAAATEMINDSNTPLPLANGDSGNGDNNAMCSKERATLGYPLQCSGESVGLVRRVRLTVMDTPVRFVSLLEKRVVVDHHE